MGYAFAILDVEYAVVPGRGHRAVEKFDDGLDSASFDLGSFDRNSPGTSLWTAARGSDLAADLNQVIESPEQLESVSDMVDTVALCDCGEIDLHFGIAFCDECGGVGRGGGIRSGRANAQHSCSESLAQPLDLGFVWRRIDAGMVSEPPSGD